jgi:hypothetical protein
VLEHFKMSFLYYVNILVVANLVGALAPWPPDSRTAGAAPTW